MTRKDYELIAISFGATLREHAPQSKEYNAIIDAALNLAADLRSTNPRFDSDRFVEFTLDVAAERRNLDGKRVAA